MLDGCGRTEELLAREGAHCARARGASVRRPLTVLPSELDWALERIELVLAELA